MTEAMMQTIILLVNVNPMTVPAVIHQKKMQAFEKKNQLTTMSQFQTKRIHLMHHNHLDMSLKELENDDRQNDPDYNFTGESNDLSSEDEVPPKKVMRHAIIPQEKGGGEPSIFEVQGSSISGEPIIPEGEPLIPDGELPIPDGELPIPDGELPIPDGELPIPEGELPITEGKPLISVGELPIPERREQPINPFRTMVGSATPVERPWSPATSTLGSLLERK
ncbi:hypothetical protein HOLleu_09584 [Holothuria leucospilota]|uniref:Uncharacterized protein n=1 Tax=Holothuria leucospilota TaxID=206669 RepID=A0A9Q1CD46_HOLLE|nr:hypothetical protein HOLleu_09584 [Holothuria leucospilota]